MKAYIRDISRYLPSRVLTNADLEKMVETSDEWIVTRTGIRERRLAADDESASDMGVCAAKALFAKGAVGPKDIDLLLVATMTPDYTVPSTAMMVQTGLGLKDIGAFDLYAACSGWMYALQTAKAFVLSGQYRNVLLITTEKMSSIIDFRDRNTCVLFGDGAAAAVISSDCGKFEIEKIVLGADGEQWPLIYTPAGGTRQRITQKAIDCRDDFVKMDGKAVYKHAVRRMEAVVLSCLEKNGLSEKDISYLVPHQANLRIIEAISKRLALSEDKVFNTLHKYGNTSAASIPIGLDELNDTVSLQGSQRILMMAFGAGLTWGAGVLKVV